MNIKIGPTDFSRAPSDSVTPLQIPKLLKIKNPSKVQPATALNALSVNDCKHALSCSALTDSTPTSRASPISYPIFSVVAVICTFQN